MKVMTKDKKNKLVHYISLLLLIPAFVLLVHVDSTVQRVTNTSDQIRLLPRIDNPKEFAASFDPSREQPVSLEAEGWQNLIWHSSIYPYSKLKRVFVGGVDCGRVGVQGEVRYLLIDSRWNIFWIEMTRCFEKPKLFGPFFSTTKITI
jgi:hypothetical protein